MNRDIRFRAWDTREKKMYHDVGWFEEQWLSPDTESGALLNVIIPMQFTGLYDRNGQEIYEGDVVLIPHTYPRGDTKIGIVRWSEKFVAFILELIEYRDLCDIHLANEVLGNIYENGGLLPYNPHENGSD